MCENVMFAPSFVENLAIQKKIEHENISMLITSRSVNRSVEWLKSTNATNSNSLKYHLLNLNFAKLPKYT